ncbi:phosphoribosyltransferase family protein [Acetobacter fallax]|uniref:Adenine phosphoribosyltransferase n=1 Tax=Acetobacter fallax TaxID=1737473 RepID=A0ABX0K5U6_9PROT|nr:phosphoribosyltransferase family protein [Acetobacter fallax]NHO31208.1 adenine phosphoribosyltransferase [Acetobacter fallax]NHO34765.1 adenine phosphoribosyltransferase [Acetobacter fallax]
MKQNEPLRAVTSWEVDVAGYPLSLPITPVSPDRAIALMMITDLGVSFGDHIGAALAERFRPLKPELVIGTATLGIPVAIEVTRHLGLDKYVILQKSPKKHLADALTYSLSSVTSHGTQELRLDKAALPMLMRRRVIVVDDVIATGSSLLASLVLARQASAEVVGLGAVLTDGEAWRSTLGKDAALVQALAHIPQFRNAGPGRWEPIAESGA